jgi:Family of unknown function (DUF6338)
VTSSLCCEVSSIVRDVSPKDAWKHHLGELASFGLVVGILIPTLIGLGLSWWLRRAEQGDQLKAWHYALGGRDYRKAWDYVFGQRQGAYLLFTLAGNGQRQYFLGKYGAASWASQAPTHPHEIYIEEVWPADADGLVDQDALKRKPSRGMWIGSDRVERMEIIN